MPVATRLFSLHIFASATLSWACEAGRSLFRHCQTPGDVASVALATSGFLSYVQLLLATCRSLLGRVQALYNSLHPFQALALVVGNSVPRLECLCDGAVVTPGPSTAPTQESYPPNFCGTNPCISIDY